METGGVKPDPATNVAGSGDGDGAISSYMNAASSSSSMVKTLAFEQTVTSNMRVTATWSFTVVMAIVFYMKPNRELTQRFLWVKLWLGLMAFYRTEGLAGL
ncbi:hypothetical protein LOK49_LG03G02893 [Camellia lanceoleosa]|uniref:Uncharacterized protein n=1 Tax=Camellia lanceoleosa TaxID=1840588 RepID=A0ACC0IDY2_9ERIC|nr:hypothetical protein LOK49_LG03G02893 [Camellia lanceoleosa]